jgi:hypothetical protein
MTLYRFRSCCLTTRLAGLEGILRKQALKKAELIGQK